MDVKDAIVSIDAMGTQKAIAAKIIDKGGDYVLPVKANQGNLEQDVKALLDEDAETLRALMETFDAALLVEVTDGAPELAGGAQTEVAAG